MAVFLWAEEGLRLYVNLADRIGVEGCGGRGEVVLAHEHVLSKPKTVNFYLKEKKRDADIITIGKESGSVSKVCIIY